MTQLEELVLAEAKALKKHATKDEINNLDFTNLFPTMTRHCIYGQMTGSCFSERAIDLIEKSAKRVFSDSGNGLRNIKKRDLNGAPKKHNRFSYYSPIEVFIARTLKGQPKHNERLISFLKGETKTLF